MLVRVVVSTSKMRSVRGQRRDLRAIGLAFADKLADAGSAIGLDEAADRLRVE